MVHREEDETRLDDLGAFDEVEEDGDEFHGTVYNLDEVPAGEDDDLSDEERIDRLEAEVADLRGKWLRAVADFRNYQQRSSENERQAREDGRTAIVRALMPALDNLDLAVAQQDTGTPAEQLVEGMRAVAKQMGEIFSGVGVTVVRPETGDAFDPHLHQAVLQSPSLEVEPGCVLNVIQSGYLLGERVLRPAGVIVAIEASPEMRAQAEAAAAAKTTEAGDEDSEEDAAG